MEAAGVEGDPICGGAKASGASTPRILFVHLLPNATSKASGASTPRILFVHLLPNATSMIVVSVTMGMGVYIGTEIFLSWLGLGIQPPRPSLGVMLFQGGHISVVRQHWWLLIAPGLVAWVLVLGWNLLGDALNDVLNPRTR